LSGPVYAIAQASKAVIPRDAGGPFGQRIGVSVSGNQNLVVSAFVTRRVSPRDWWRYSLVVLNQCVSAPRSARAGLLTRAAGSRNDNSTGSWDPVGIAATIAFKGLQVRARSLRSRDWRSSDAAALQARYTFPVGATTLWWYAAPETDELLYQFTSQSLDVMY